MVGPAGPGRQRPRTAWRTPAGHGRQHGPLRHARDGVMKLRIDSERCQGHGRCYDLAPGLFGDDDEGYGQVLGDGVVHLPVALVVVAEEPGGEVITATMTL